MGDLVANNEKSAAIIVPLLDNNPETGERLDYTELGESWKIFATNSPTAARIKSIHIIGFCQTDG